MKPLLAVCVLFISCTKQTSYQSRAISLSNSALVVHGSLDLQTTDANIASLGILNYRSSYELCGTSGNGLMLPLILQLSDSTVYPSSILNEGDSLSAKVFLDSTVRKNYKITLVIKENNVVVNTPPVCKNWTLTGKFVFHSGSKYNVSATVQ